MMHDKGWHMKNIKAQAALEFLLTYGWAILSVLVVLGALTYFGVFNTSKYVSDTCNFGDQLNCEDYKITVDGWVSFRLRNNLGVAIDVTGASVQSDFGTVTCPNIATTVIQHLSSNPVVPGNTNIQAGDLFEINCRTGAAFVQNQKYSIHGTVSFERTGSTNVHNETGDIYNEASAKGTCSDNQINCHDAGCEISECGCNMQHGGPCGVGVCGC